VSGEGGPLEAVPDADAPPDAEGFLPPASCAVEMFFHSCAVWGRDVPGPEGMRMLHLQSGETRVTIVMTPDNQWEIARQATGDARLEPGRVSVPRPAILLPDGEPANRAARRRVERAQRRG
jgi:hypothetical protein